MKGVLFLAAVKWIKIVTDIFDDEKILLIESLPEADSIIVIWFKLLCLAGKTNAMGVLLMNDRIAYNDEMLAHIFRRPLNIVRLALKTFESYGMIEIINNTITIPNWCKHQQLDSIEKNREQTKKRVAAYRERQKQLLENEGNNVNDEAEECNALQDVSVTQCNADRIRIRIEEDKDIDINNIYSSELVAPAHEPEPEKESEPAVYQIILNDKTYFDVTQSMIDSFQELYPAVDVHQEIRKMIGWAENNPKRRKTIHGIRAFMNSWLSREQDKGPRVGTKQRAEIDFTEILKGD